MDTEPRPLTDDEKKAECGRIIELMELHKQDRRLVAMAMGIPIEVLRAKLKHYPQKLFSKPRHPLLPPTEMATVHREVLALAPETNGGELLDEQTILAIEKENHLLQKGLHALKLSDAGLELGQSFHKFQAQNFSRSATIVAGGLIRRYVENEVEIDKLWRELEKLRAHDGAMGELDVMREKTLLSGIIDLTDVQQKAYKLIVDAGLTSVLIKEKMAGLNGGNAPKSNGKPGFGPKQRQTLVKVEKGGTVNLKA